MFYEVKNLSCSVDLAPRYFGPTLKEAVSRQVVEKVQWSRIHVSVGSKFDEAAVGRFEGFAVHAYVPDMSAVDLAKGKIHEDTGEVQFHVKYNAIVMRPQVGDVFDALVTSIEQSGVVCQYGPLCVFVPYTGLGEYSEYDAAGQWRQEIPDEDGNVDSIQEGSVIRIKVTSVRSTTHGMDVFGSINGEAYGLIAYPMNE